MNKETKYVRIAYDGNETFFTINDEESGIYEIPEEVWDSELEELDGKLWHYENLDDYKVDTF